MKHKIIAAAFGCGCAIVLSCIHSFWLIPAFLFLFWLAYLAFTAQKASETDALTGLRNLLHLRNHYGRYRKCGSLTVLYFDLDDLKQVNDNQGHDMGNAALQEMAACLTQAAGKTAAAYRIGGDEFLLISETSDTARLTIRWEQEAQNLKHSTVSFGCAVGAGSNLDDLIRKAERAMYRQK